SVGLVRPRIVVHADAERAATLDSEVGRGSLGGLRLADVREQTSEHTCGEAEHRTPAQELRAIQLVTDQLVDQVVLDRAGCPATVLLDRPPRLAVHLLPPIRWRARSPS